MVSLFLKKISKKIERKICYSTKILSISRSHPYRLLWVIIKRNTGVLTYGKQEQHTEEEGWDSDHCEEQTDLLESARSDLIYYNSSN